MKKVLPSIAALAAAAVLAFGPATAPAQQPPIRLGALFCVTGGLASLDGPALAGAKLKVAELNAAGGVLGRKLELVVLDGKSDAATIATATSQLIGSDKVPMIVGLSDSDHVLAMGPIGQKAGIPMVAVGATSPKLPAQVGDNLFMASFGDNVQAAAGAEYLLKKLGAKTAYVLYDTGTEYTTLLQEYFKVAYEKGGGKLAGTDTYKSGDTSFTAQITKIKALRPAPQALYISAMPDEIGVIVKQLRQAGVKLPVVGGDGYDTPLLVEVGGAAADGVAFTTHSYMAPDGSAPVKKFIAAYQAANKAAPENAFAALGYDAVGMAADAIKRAGSVEPAKIRAALAATSGYAGVSGSISYTAGNRVPDKTVAVIGVKAKKLYLAAEIKPAFVPAP
ncbi:MAG: ABC transporter substrate-binding protein [Burkholderiales bacterium]|jgi:branched-chain amino acid transport system substrate-binding protein|nr:ABC transporter substrate-binding protein [Burkholderiales bacterium]